MSFAVVGLKDNAIIDNHGRCYLSGSAQRQIGVLMRPMPQLEIVEVPVSELVEYQNNVTCHNGR